MIIFGILCTLIGIFRIITSLRIDDFNYSQLKNVDINININSIKIILILIGIIEIFCGLFVYLNV